MISFSDPSRWQILVVDEGSGGTQILWMQVAGAKARDAGIDLAAEIAKTARYSHMVGAGIVVKIEPRS